ncbi:MGD1 [Auxenochlorella protothecoides x Auxenochlorella symbiontica]
MLPCASPIPIASLNQCIAHTRGVEPRASLGLKPWDWQFWVPTRGPPRPCRGPEAQGVGPAGGGRDLLGPPASTSERGDVFFQGKPHLPNLSMGGGSGQGIGYSSFFLIQAPRLWPFSWWSPPKKLRTEEEKKRILILMSDTGGGHRASAQALKAGFEELYGDAYKIDVLDIWTDYTPWPCNRLPKTYSFLVKYPFLWRLGFLTSQPRFVHVPVTTATAAFVGPQVSRAFDETRPDLVVSVHPLMQIVPVRVLRQRIRNGLQKAINFATVVTDLTRCHNTWYYHRVDRCFVATEASKRQALDMGLKEDQIRLYGLPIRPAFSRKYPPKEKLRKSLQMDPRKPAILLVGGGEGMGPVERTVEALSKVLDVEFQLVVVCGRNHKLVERLKRREYPAGMQVHVKGFVDNMPEFMFASDIMITKAGPGTISEALICGLPMILNAYIPCQEEANIPYVVENEVGLFERNPHKVALIVKGWLGDQAGQLRAMAQRCRKLGQPDALFNIVRELSSMVAA